MICPRCGASLRPSDRFCSQCGAVVEPKSDSHPAQSGRRKKRETQESTYRDTFLVRGESGQRARTFTLVLLALIAAAVLGGLAYFVLGPGQQYLFGSLNHGGGTSGESEIVSLDEEGDAASNGSGTAGDAAADGSDTAGNLNGDAANGTGAQAGSGADGVNAADGAGQTENQDVTEEPPTEEPQTEDASDRIDTSEMERILAEDSEAGTYAAFVYDLKTGKSYGTASSTEKMYTSATLTVPILYTAAVRLDQGAVTLNDTIEFENSIGGRGLYNVDELVGREFSLSWYLTNMLMYSDNNCMNCLLGYLGLEAVNHTCQSAGFTSVDLQRMIVADVTDGKENYASAQDLAMMVKELYNGRFQIISRSFMEQYFRIDETDANRTLIGLADELPETVKFLNQNGKGDTRYSEVAVVADDETAYVISVMLSGEYGYAYEEAVKELSGYVWNCLSPDGEGAVDDGTIIISQ